MSYKKSKSSVNRRKFRRLKMDRMIQVPVQVFPVLPFVGHSQDAALINLSTGGMGLLLEESHSDEQLTKGMKLNVHFRIPGLPLTACQGLITNSAKDKETGWTRLGIKFTKASKTLEARIKQMVMDDEICNYRINESLNPRCDLSCSYHALCNKPIRDTNGESAYPQFEITLQHQRS